VWYNNLGSEYGFTVCINLFPIGNATKKLLNCAMDKIAKTLDEMLRGTPNRSLKSSKKWSVLILVLNYLYFKYKCNTMHKASNSPIPEYHNLTYLK